MLPAVAATSAHLDVLEAALKTARLALAAASGSAPTRARAPMAVEAAAANASVSPTDEAATLVRASAPMADAAATLAHASAPTADEAAAPAAKRARRLDEHTMHEAEYMRFVPAQLATLVLAAQTPSLETRAAHLLAGRVDTAALRVLSADINEHYDNRQWLQQQPPGCATSLDEAQARAHTRFEHELACCRLLKTTGEGFPGATLLIVTERYGWPSAGNRECVLVLVGTDRRLASALASCDAPVHRASSPSSMRESLVDLALQQAIAAWFASERLKLTFAQRRAPPPAERLLSAGTWLEGGLHALVDVLEVQARVHLAGRPRVRLNPRPPGNEHGVMVMGDTMLASTLADRLRCRVLPLMTRKLPHAMARIDSDEARGEVGNDAYACRIKRMERAPPQDAINVILVVKHLDNGSMLAAYATLATRLPFTANIVLALALEDAPELRAEARARPELAGVRIAVAF